MNVRYLPEDGAAGGALPLRLLCGRPVVRPAVGGGEGAGAVPGVVEAEMRTTLSSHFITSRFYGRDFWISGFTVGNRYLLGLNGAVVLYDFFGS